MKLIVKETVTKEVEIKLPAYRKSNCHFFKVISENLCLKVTELTSHCGIDYQSFSDSALSSDNVDSTEEEFLEAYDRILARLDELKNM